LGKILATVPDELENRLRKHLRKQDGLSRIVTEVFKSYLDRIEKKEKKQNATPAYSTESRDKKSPR
jgi:hypothetical protein